MEVTCEDCKAKLNLPDEKIPKDQVVSLTCPKCKRRITVDTRTGTPRSSVNPSSEKSREGDDFRMKFIEPNADAGRNGDSYNYEDYSDDKALDFFEEGIKLALVLENTPEHQSKIRRSVEELGYRFIASADTRDATGKMRFHHFDIIVLSDGFDGQPLERSPILNYLNRMSMSVRRRIFVALLGDRFKTMDNMMSFALSANVVINKREMDRLSAVFKKAISDNTKFYKVFMDELTASGKA
ncbi:MAG: zinc-ribbon domain-containing protein [Desulfatiglandales bacterium]